MAGGLLASGRCFLVPGIFVVEVRRGGSRASPALFLATARYSLSIFEPDEFPRATLRRRDGGVSEAEERVHDYRLGLAVKLDAVGCEFGRKGRGMRPVGGAALNRLVRYEPRVAPAMPVPSRRMVPSGDVALVRVRHAKGQAVQRDVAALGQVKDVFVTIVQKPLRIDGLVVTALNQALRSRPTPGWRWT